ncbi:polysaccharide deacetylase family protein [Paenibacillus sp. IB182496]|uniref:Polysaccharide deacetylase family protein n=2 Tax=Paenibacillus sabuli TaxID=2772509 RepID=A0A927BPL1_9BACL|nr:polysaccharide deacetylase family protein [Paenibacillus sabuli]
MRSRATPGASVRRAARSGAHALPAVAMLAALFMLAGCGWFEGGSGPAAGGTGPEAAPVLYTGEPSPAIQSVYTSSRQLSLTFNGLADAQTMHALLDELDRLELRATFFVPGMRVAEEPDLARLIVERGHELENNTLSSVNLSELDYAQVHREIALSQEVIERETGVVPSYVRSRSGDITANMQLAAADLGLDAVVGYSINPRDTDMQSAEEIGAYVERYLSRGGIVLLHTDYNPEIVSAIRYIAEAAHELRYELVTLRELVSGGETRLAPQEIPGYDAVRLNPDYADQDYELIYQFETEEREVALTINNWASDQTMTAILDILDEYDVKATFFLRMKGVEANPNMARALVDAGHEVANHSYNHEVVTTLTPEQLQADVVKAHQVLTEAIQEQPLMLYRPPTGAISEESARIIAATGYHRIAMYDVTTMDWDVANDAETIVSRIMAKTKSGSIILLHALDGTHVLEALPEAIRLLRQEGYRFVLMSEALGLEP